MPDQQNVTFTPKQGYAGMNLNNIPSQKGDGVMAYALNAVVEGIVNESEITYQNEPANVECATFPDGYKVIGKENIIQLNKILVMLTNPSTGDSQIGTITNCIYTALIDDSSTDCKFGFDIYHPIKEIIIKTTACSTQAYWTDGLNPRRYIDLDNLPWKEVVDPTNDFKKIPLVGELDCNKLLVQPNFTIPQITPIEEPIGGKLTTAVYQGSVQYANSLGEGLTSFYSTTNPIGVFEQKNSGEFNLPTSKAITFHISNLDTSGLYEYFNLAIIVTINNISTPYIVGTFPISKSEYEYTYTGAESNLKQINIADIFEKYPYYDIADGAFEVANLIGWYGLKKNEDINYQKIWSKVKLQWETHKLPYNAFEAYTGINTALYKGYMRDEVYPFEGMFLLTNGRETPAFHIPGREATAFDREIIHNKDSDGIIDNKCDIPSPKQRWEVYNTGSVIDKTDEYKNNTSSNCIEVPIEEPPIDTPSVITGTVLLNCTDKNCTEQGVLFLTFKFDKPTPASGLNLEIGCIFQGITENGAAGYVGLFTLPIGTVPEDYFGHGNKNTPFLLHIPGGVTEYTTTEPLKNGSAALICQSCSGPILEIFVRTDGGVVMNLSATTQHGQNVGYNYIPSNIPVTPSPPPETETICTECYTGSYEYGEFGYWESAINYPNNQFIWGELAGKPIRHHKFPDLLTSPIHDNNSTNDPTFEYSIFPIGIRVVMESLYNAIKESDLTQEQKDSIIGFKIVRGNRTVHKSIIAKGLLTNVGKSVYDGKTYYYPNYPFNDLHADPYFSSVKIERTSQTPIGYKPELALNGFPGDDKSRFTFHSPDTHFFSPSLSDEGEYLKLETIEFGASRSHFVKVEDNAEYKFLTPSTIYAAGGLAQASGLIIGAGTFGWPNYDMSKAIPTFTAAQEMFEKLAPYTNFGYSFNSVGVYGNSYAIPNDGNKIRKITFNEYLNDGINKGDSGTQFNNIRRESSVYIKTQENLLFPHEYSSSIPIDNSRYNLASIGDTTLPPEVIRNRDISAYYGSIKKDIPGQWGQMYGYETIDTGYFQLLYPNGKSISIAPTVFGGDIFINKFAYKVKQPIFRLNTVGKANQTDIQGNELGTINYPMFYISTKPANFELDIDDEIKKLGDEFQDPSFFEIIGNLFTGGAVAATKAMSLLIEIIKQLYETVGVKNINLDRQITKGITEQGLMYLFAYGIPTFFCESEVNVDFRQAYNNQEGNFYPNVGGDIPDDWLQERNVPILYDNTYTYNQTYSKQNKENYFSHLREDFDPTKLCLVEFPNRAIWSEASTERETKNNWLLYKPASYFDFSKSYGKLTALNGIENRQVLARFENKTLLYNALVTAKSSISDIYLGQPIFSKEVPPLDYADTDVGYVGCQNRFLLKTEYGHITTDAERGQVFLLNGQQAIDLTREHVSKFFTEFLSFQIKKAFPDVNIDNNFNGVGLHGVYDTKFNRLILTKIDYKPLIKGIIHSDGIYTYNGEEISLDNPEYFCNYSFTISYNFDYKIWVSFHSYIPNFYIAGANIFHSGRNTLALSSLWTHNQDITKFNNFYGDIHPYIIEYPYSFQPQDQIIQSVKDYTKSIKYIDWDELYETDDYFNKLILSSNTQCSGLLLLTPKPKNNLQAYGKYPIYNLDSKEVLVTKSDNFYQVNTFWDLVDSKSQPIWKRSCENLSIFKSLNQDNMSYGKRSFKKAPLRSKDLKVRLILDDKDDVKLLSNFTILQSQTSFK